MERKITPLKGKLIVTSRGIKEEMEGGVVVPTQYLVDSDICTNESGGKLVRKSGAGYPLGDHKYILLDEHVIARLFDGEWQPTMNMVIVRKCLDAEDQSGLVMLGSRKNRFAEVLAAGPLSGLETFVGSLVHVDEAAGMPQKVEDTIDDWLVSSDMIEFITGDDT